MGGYNRDLLDCMSESGNKGGSVISLFERSIFARAVFLKIPFFSASCGCFLGEIFWPKKGLWKAYFLPSQKVG